MKRFLNILGVITVLLFLTAACTPAPTVPEDVQEGNDVITSGVLQVVTCADFPPIVYRDETGAFAGSDMELCRYLADKLEVELEITEAELSEFAAKLNSGEADIALGGIGETEIRKETMLLSQPYFSRKESDTTLLCRKEEAESYAEAADFSGAAVGVQEASLQYDLVCDQLPGAVIVTFSTLDEGCELWNRGEIDVLAAPLIVSNSLSDCAPAAFNLKDPTTAYVLATAKGREDWMEEINLLLDSVVEQNLYENWLTACSEE